MLGDLRTNLSGITIDGLLAAEYQVKFGALALLQHLDCSGQRAAGGQCTLPPKARSLTR